MGGSDHCQFKGPLRGLRAAINLTGHLQNLEFWRCRVRGRIMRCLGQRCMLWAFFGMKFVLNTRVTGNWNVWKCVFVWRRPLMAAKARHECGCVNIWTCLGRSWPRRPGTCECLNMCRPLMAVEARHEHGCVRLSTGWGGGQMLWQMEANRLEADLDLWVNGCHRKKDQWARMEHGSGWEPGPKQWFATGKRAVGPGSRGDATGLELHNGLAQKDDKSNDVGHSVWLCADSRWFCEMHVEWLMCQQKDKTENETFVFVCACVWTHLPEAIQCCSWSSRVVPWVCC